MTDEEEKLRESRPGDVDARPRKAAIRVRGTAETNARHLRVRSRFFVRAGKQQMARKAEQGRKYPADLGVVEMKKHRDRGRPERSETGDIARTTFNMGFEGKRKFSCSGSGRPRGVPRA